MRIRLFDFGEDAAETASGLADIGHDVALHDDRVGPPLPETRPPPQVLVVSLGAEPGRALDALAVVASIPGSKTLPILFTGGDETSMAAAQERFPRANFTRRKDLYTALASLRA